MKKYALEIPLSGYFWCEVEAENEEDAFDVACEMFSNKKNIDEPTSTYELLELDPLQKVVEGNVFHGSLDEWSCTEVKEQVDEARDEGADADPGGK